MKPLFRIISTQAVNSFFFSIFSILFITGITYATISWPSVVPNGEVAGGKFATYFANMLGDSNRCGANMVIAGFDEQGNPRCVPSGGGGRICHFTDPCGKTPFTSYYDWDGVMCFRRNGELAESSYYNWIRWYGIFNGDIPTTDVCAWAIITTP